MKIAGWSFTLLYPMKFTDDFSWQPGDVFAKPGIQKKIGNLPLDQTRIHMNRIEQLKTFLLQNPNDSFLNHALALEYVKAEQYEEAKAAFLKNTDNNPDYVPTYFHLGKLYEKIRSYSEALRCYETGIEKAQKSGDHKTVNELRMALEFLEDELES